MCVCVTAFVHEATGKLSIFDCVLNIYSEILWHGIKMRLEIRVSTHPVLIPLKHLTCYNGDLMGCLVCGLYKMPLGMLASMLQCLGLSPLVLFSFLLIHTWSGSRCWLSGWAPATLVGIMDWGPCWLPTLAWLSCGCGHLGRRTSGWSCLPPVYLEGIG